MEHRKPVAASAGCKLLWEAQLIVFNAWFMWIVWVLPEELMSAVEELLTGKDFFRRCEPQHMCVEKFKLDTVFMLINFH